MLLNILKVDLLLCFHRMIQSQAKFVQLISVDAIFLLGYWLTHLSFELRKLHYLHDLGKKLKVINLLIAKGGII